MDFGNSFSPSEEGEGPTQTLNYRSPEAISRRGSFEVDVWGLGCTLYFMLTGEHLISEEVEREDELEAVFEGSNE